MLPAFLALQDDPLAGYGLFQPARNQTQLAEGCPEDVTHAGVLGVCVCRLQRGTGQPGAGAQSMCVLGATRAGGCCPGCLQARARARRASCSAWAAPLAACLAEAEVDCAARLLLPCHGPLQLAFAQFLSSIGVDLQG